MIILDLTKHLPKRGHHRVGLNDYTLYTWVELANGEHCSRNSGAEMGKVHITMNCDGPWKYVSDIDQSSPIWIAHLFNGTWRHITKTRVPVTEAWR